MFNLFNSPMLNSLRRTVRPPTLVTGGDGSPAPFPLPLPGGIPEPDAVFGAEPSAPPITLQPEQPRLKAQPELDIPFAQPPTRAAAAVNLASNDVPDMERKRFPSGSVLTEIGNAVAEGGADVLQKVTEGREAASKLLADGKDAVLQRVSDGRDAVRQKEELIHNKSEAATVRDRQIIGGLREQAEQHKLEKAKERNRAETRKAVEGLGDTEFVADVDDKLEDNLHRAHEMSETEALEFRNNLLRARSLGLNEAKSRRASRIFENIRQLGVIPETAEFFPTAKLAAKLERLEDGILQKGLSMTLVGGVLRENTINELREVLSKRSKAGDKEARQALERISGQD